MSYSTTKIESILNSAENTRQISQSDSNYLRRCYNILPPKYKDNVELLDQWVKDGYLEIIPDDSGSFNSDGYRISSGGIDDLIDMTWNTGVNPFL